MSFQVKVYTYIVFLLVASLVGCTGKQETRELKQLFDLNWRFYLGENPAASEFDFNDKQWINLDLPHDWSSDERLKKNIQEEGEQFLQTDGWYRKKFQLPSDWHSKKVSVFFDGAKMKTEVFINGNFVGENPGSSDSFQFDLTPYLNKKGENVLAVRVNKPLFDDNKWQKGTGISRHVWLLVADQIYFK